MGKLKCIPYMAAGTTTRIPKCLGVKQNKMALTNNAFMMVDTFE
jgi:hypothetical protein